MGGDAGPGDAAEATGRDLTDELVDPDAIRAYLADHLGGTGEDYRIERHMQGHSNETFFLTWEGKDYVLRRPPLGDTLPTAHDVLREHRVLHALNDADVRTPRAVLACDDEDVLGKPFYLMERVHGTVPRQALPAALDDPKNRRRVGEDHVDALVEVHAVDVDAVGLGDLGPGAGYLGRQVDRWRQQMEFVLPMTEEVRDVPDLPRTADWLADHRPDEPATTLVHGDYKLDNVVLAPDPPARIAGILDWEMATLGDPLADLGWLSIFWRDAGDPADDLAGLLPTFTADEGFPTRAELVKRYESRTGLPVDHLGFYQVLALFKLATLLEMAYARHLAGTTDDPFFAELEWAVPALAAKAVEGIADVEAGTGTGKGTGTGTETGPGTGTGTGSGTGTGEAAP